MDAQAIPYGLYTDIIFSFATINAETFRVSAGDIHNEWMMSRIGTIKLIQPGIKIWIAIGGWTFNDPGPTQTTFSDIAASADKTHAFILSLTSMMIKYGFDGVDIDWEYPVAEDRAGRPRDYKNIVSFMRKLKFYMLPWGKKVSIAIPASYWYLQNFDLKALESTVDWFNIMTYDMHGSWDIDNEFTGPLANSHTNMTEIQQALDLLWRNDIDPDKVTMGMAFYSRTFTLTDPACNDVGCQVSSAGNPGPCSDTAGVLLHPEIADIIKEKSLTPKVHTDAAVKTVSWDNQWVSFDDISTWRLKGLRARSQCITSFMVWAMSQDDDEATNAQALNRALEREPTPPPDLTGPYPDGPIPAPVLAPQLCRWTSCFDECPDGFAEVDRDGHNDIMRDSSPCYLYYNQWLGHGFTRLCCPTSHTLPTCTWRGHRNSGECRPGCEENEVELGSLGLGCHEGHQVACCTKSEVTEKYGQCFWSDCMDDPSIVCSDPLLFSSKGWSGLSECSGTRTRAFCCTEPAPAEFKNDCKWVKTDGRIENNEGDICEGACPEGHLRLALERGSHVGEKCWGNLAYCCADLKPVDPRDDPEDDYELGKKMIQRFRGLLDDYMEDPTCPAEVLQPPIGPFHGILSRQSAECSLKDWNDLMGMPSPCLYFIRPSTTLLERTGTMYLPTRMTQSSRPTRFKSTCGTTRNWRFSLRSSISCWIQFPQPSLSER